MTHHRYELADGRHIGVSAVGEPAATRIVVFCLPTPGAGAFDPDPEVTSRSGLKIIEIDRPGYGGSDPLPDNQTPSVERFADDIAEYLTHSEVVATESTGVQLKSVGVIGWSFGGAVAIAFAACHPELVHRLAIIAAPSPSRWRKGERYSAIAELRKRGVERRFSDLRDSLSHETLLWVRSLGIDEADPALTPLGVRGRVERMIEAGWANDAAGVASDRLAVRDDAWAKELDTVRADALLIYGDSDPVATSAHARWYEKRLTAVERETVVGAGHALIVSEWARVLKFFEPHE